MIERKMCNSKLLEIIVCSASFIFCTSALAAESWTCSYKSYTGDDLVIARIEVGAGRVIWSSPIRGLPGAMIMDYKLLENNDTGLVASYPIIDEDVGAFTIVIDKRSGIFTRTNTFTNESDTGYRRGTCIRNPG